MAPGTRRHGGSIGIVTEAELVGIEYATRRHGQRQWRPQAQSPWKWPSCALVAAEPTPITQLPTLEQHAASLKQHLARRVKHGGGGR